MNDLGINSDVAKNIKKPKIIKLEHQINKNEMIVELNNGEIDFLVSNNLFEPNQNASIEILDDLMELK